MDWSSGDVVYVSSICFPDSLLQVSVTTVEFMMIMNCIVICVIILSVMTNYILFMLSEYI